ncbi:DUF1028 domain-containing protein [Dongia deserti]|uniref:DUF1028 domain-containing protein n=1 Tax=Dongia deserti TaxID=2268030 RepID=UPI000E658E5B|nr:DUF1028 domain-containing protein [Dongia deserti]
MTFSIAARCTETGMFGIAVSSSSPAVAARCAHARAGVGAFGTQNITDPRLGPQGLDLMAKGASAEQAIAILKQSAPHITFRQLIAVDAQGGTAAHSGDHTLGTHATAQTMNVAAAGNLLRDAEIPAKMAAAFQRVQGHLGDRLLTAMEAALAAGGEEGPVHSAGLLIVRDVPWPVADLRVDWSDGDPIAELRRLWTIYKPQLEDYVTRALDPTAAPSFGVPGDQ